MVPIFAAFDHAAAKGKIFFYDLLGAEFECVDFCATGSGAHIVRGALYYQNRWGPQPLREMAGEQAVELLLKMLETAAEYDTRTGGFRESAHIFPQVVQVTAAGLSAVPDEELARALSKGLRRMLEEPYRWVEAINNRREYLEDQLASGSPVVGTTYADGVLLLTATPGPRKLFEVYDEIAFAAVGHPADIEKLRKAVIDIAHLEGFNLSANDVTLQRLVSFGIGPLMKAAFDELFRSPFIARVMMAELDPDGGGDALFHR